MATAFGELKSLLTIKRTLLVRVVEMGDNWRGIKGLNGRILSYT